MIIIKNHIFKSKKLKSKQFANLIEYPNHITLSIYPSIHLSIYPSIHLSSPMSHSLYQATLSERNTQIAASIFWGYSAYTLTGIGCMATAITGFISAMSSESSSDKRPKIFVALTSETSNMFRWRLFKICIPPLVTAGIFGAAVVCTAIQSYSALDMAGTLNEEAAKMLFE